MALQSIEFRFMTGLKRKIFRNMRLRGSWYGGRYSDSWTESPMAEDIGEDGCPIFKGSVCFDLVDQHKTFKWGVVLDGPEASNFWGIPTEIHDINSFKRYRTFALSGVANQIERYYFTYCRRLGANKYFATGKGRPGLRFAVWAPNAKKVDVVFGYPPKGYINDDGTGIDPAQPVVPLIPGANDIWEGKPKGSFSKFQSLPYMYRIVNAPGKIVYHTDIFSRSQIGKGAIDPSKNPWPGTLKTLDGRVSCSVVIVPDVV